MANTNFDENGIPIGTILVTVDTVAPTPIGNSGPAFTGEITTQQYQQSYEQNSNHSEKSSSQDKTITVDEQITQPVTVVSTKEGGGGTQINYNTHSLSFQITIPISLSPA